MGASQHSETEASKPLEKVVVWYACFNDGSGGVNLKWYTTEEQAEHEDREQEEGWGEPSVGHVETFIGSDIHTKAVKNVK